MGPTLPWGMMFVLDVVQQLLHGLTWGLGFWLAYRILRPKWNK